MYVIYRSPNSSRENNEALNDLMRTMKSESVIIGDLNFPGIEWRSGKCDAKGRGFYEACEDKFIKQFVEEPTHISGNTLDLVLCGEEGMIGEVETAGRLGQSDHEILCVTIKGKAKRGEKQEWFRDYHRAKYGEMRNELSKDWDNVLSGKGVNDMWLTIKGAILDAIEVHVPMRRRKKKNVPPWMDKETMEVIKEKKKRWREWKGKKTEEKKREYKKAETETKKKIRNKKKAFEKRIAKESKVNPKGFYAYVNAGNRRRAEIGPLKKEGSIVVEPRAKAELLNDYYSSVFTRSKNPSPRLAEEERDNNGDYDNGERNRRSDRWPESRFGPGTGPSEQSDSERNERGAKKTIDVVV